MKKRNGSKKNTLHVKEKGNIIRKGRKRSDNALCQMLIICFNERKKS